MELALPVCHQVIGGRALEAADAAPEWPLLRGGGLVVAQHLVHRLLQPRPLSLGRCGGDLLQFLFLRLLLLSGIPTVGCREVLG